MYLKHLVSSAKILEGGAYNIQLISATPKKVVWFTKLGWNLHSYILTGSIQNMQLSKLILLALPTSPTSSQSGNQTFTRGAYNPHSISVTSRKVVSFIYDLCSDSMKPYNKQLMHLSMYSPTTPPREYMGL